MLTSIAAVAGSPQVLVVVIGVWTDMWLTRIGASNLAVLCPHSHTRPLRATRVPRTVARHMSLCGGGVGSGAPCSSAWTLCQAWRCIVVDVVGEPRPSPRPPHPCSPRAEPASLAATSLVLPGPGCLCSWVSVCLASEVIFPTGGGNSALGRALRAHPCPVPAGHGSGPRGSCRGGAVRWAVQWARGDSSCLACVSWAQLVCWPSCVVFWEVL